MYGKRAGSLLDALLVLLPILSISISFVVSNRPAWSETAARADVLSVSVSAYLR
jgi:hypothetical protein